MYKKVRFFKYQETVHRKQLYLVQKTSKNNIIVNVYACLNVEDVFFMTNTNKIHIPSVLYILLCSVDRSHPPTILLESSNEAF